MPMNEELLLENFLPYRLAVTSNTISTTLARAYDKRFNVSIPEWRVIAVLGRFPGLSAVEVAERTLMYKVAVSIAVKKLITNGRIVREFADTDKRRSILNLSIIGKELHDKIAVLALEFEKELKQEFSSEEMENLNRAMEKLLVRASLIGSP